ncbi:phosphopantetheine--protein transferase [Candidatus Entotheonella serta]|nr:phosphopantetheine--protein transferase [Candidatus Entotheonella serta]
MKTLAIISQKGGVGKTTLATCLAVAAENDGKKTAIFDLDPQATASFWKDIRQAETPAVASIQAIRLPAMQKAARETGADLVIIDGAAIARDVAFEAAKVADFVFIPTKAAVFDTMAMTHTLEIVRQCQKPFSIVLTFVPPVGAELEDAASAAAELNAALCPVLIGNRKAFFRAQSTGLAVQEYEPNGKAALEISELYAYMCIYLYGQPHNQEIVDHGGKFIASGA